MNPNPNWWRVGFASFVLAILLRVGLAIPFSTTFVALGIIFLTQIIYTEMRTGVDRTLAGMALVRNMAIGLVVFLALRFIAAGVLDLYPVDTYDTLASGKGLFGLLPAREIPKVVMWEILFAFVAGGIAVAWSQDRNRRLVGTVFAVSLVVVSMQIGLPRYSATFPSRTEVDSLLAEKKLRGIIASSFGSGSPPAYVTMTPTPYNQCSTSPSCEMYVDWGTDIKSGAQPVLVWFNGKKDPILLSGRGGDTISLDDFNPGVARFASPDSSTQVLLVKLFK